MGLCLFDAAPFFISVTPVFMTVTPVFISEKVIAHRPVGERPSPRGR